MDICRFRPCLVYTNPPYFAEHARDTFSRRRAREGYIQIREDQRASKICGRGSGKSGNGAAGRTGIQSIVHVIFARRFGSRPTFIKSDRQREHSHRNERLPRARVKEHILGNIATASTRGRSYRSTVRDKNRRYEEYQRWPVECSPSIFEWYGYAPLIDSVLVRIQCGSRGARSSREIALSFRRAIRLINL